MSSPVSLCFADINLGTSLWVDKAIHPVSCDLSTRPKSSEKCLYPYCRQSGAIHGEIHKGRTRPLLNFGEKRGADQSRMVVCHEQPNHVPNLL
jgi:hypothetical protein